MAWHGPYPLRGKVGPPGPQGEPGEDGPIVPGPAGPTGATGPAGAAGPMGPPGLPGDDYHDDPLPVPGPPGPTGAAGTTGAAGPMGPPGLAGEDYYGESLVAPGPAGPTGAAGSTGPTGATGPMGPPGMAGEDCYDDRIPAVSPVPDVYTLGVNRLAPGGRLTLSSGVPVTTADVTAAGTVYYTPYLHDRICLWDGGRWVWVTFSEKSVAVTSINGAAMDVFGYLSSGDLAVELAFWGNATVTMTIATPCVVTWTGHGLSSGDTVTFFTTGALPTPLVAGNQYYVTVVTADTFKLSTSAANYGAGTFVNTSGTQSGTHTGYQSRNRQTAVTWQDGRLCKSGDKTRLLLGTILATSSSTTEDSAAKRYVSNAYNAVPRELRAEPGRSDGGTLTSFTHSGANYGEVNGGTNSRASFVLTQPAFAEAGAQWAASSSASGAIVLGLSIDSPTTAFSQGAVANVSSTTYGLLTRASGMLGAGSHYFAMIAYMAAGTGTIYADDARGGGTSDPRYSYLQGWVMG